MIYLKHPVHGTKVAIAEVEAQYDESHGWSRYTLESLDLPKIEQVDLPSDTSEVAQSKRFRKPIKLEVDNQIPEFLSS